MIPGRWDLDHLQAGAGREPPLSPSRRTLRRTGQGLGLVLDGEDAVAHQRRLPDGRSMRPRAASLDDLEVVGFAAIIVPRAT